MDLRVPCLALALVLAGCATNYRNDYDPAIDFAKYRTFAIGEGKDIGKTGLLDNALTRRRVTSLIETRLAARGLREVPFDANPDLRVDYWVGVEDKQQVSTAPTTRYPATPYGYPGSPYNYPPSRYGYRNYPYDSGRWGPAYNEVMVMNYREGTLIIDLVDTGTTDLVWRTYLTRVLSENPDKNLKGADKDLEKAFENFPPVREGEAAR
ncbi:MAG: DUF4136 domain-containing protein [Deltaproteobacteria bacterium]|nr:DUF4136 domain-containing protein [Deltaproteobacteria bacterium]